MNYTPEQLFDFARTGDYPADVTAKMLANTKNETSNWTNLHTAAIYNHLPPDATPELMTNTLDDFGNNVFHDALRNTKLPATTNLHQLNIPNKQGETALDWLLKSIEHYKQSPHQHHKEKLEIGLANLTLALENTNVTTHQEIRKFAEKLKKHIPIQTTAWIQKQMLNLAKSK